MVSVYFFIPNLIGYLRIVAAVTAFYYMPFDVTRALVFYLIACFLDDIDGPAARYFDQTSNFGAILDMLTDRCQTTGLLIMLTIFYPSYVLIFQSLVCLDFTSHWLHMQSSVMRNIASHKLNTQNAILRFYYQKYVMFVLAYGTEAFYCLLYLIHFTKGPVVTLPGASFGLWVLLAGLTAPFCIIKQFINIVQLVSACNIVVQIDEDNRKKFKHQ